MIAIKDSPNLLTNEELFFHKVYWSNQLGGELPETNLILDYLRPTSYTEKDREVCFELSQQVSQKILQITQGSHFSIYLLLLTNSVIFLHRYLDREEIIVGSPSYRSELDQIIPLRFKLDSKFTFKETLELIKDTTIKSYSYQNYPVLDLIQQLQLPQSINQCPIFDLVIALENIHHSIPESINNDITIIFSIEQNLIKGKIFYKSSLFKAETIELFKQYYLNVLTEDINKIKNCQLSQIELLTKSDRFKLLHEFNRNSKEYPVNKTIATLFEEQVEKTRDSIAVIDRDICFTYHELNQKANQLARLLQNLNIQSGELIAVVKERDVNFLIAILAIFKAGGVYVPIDCTYPPERIKYMVTNSQARTILTDKVSLESLAEFLSDCPEVNYLVCLDGEINEDNYNNSIKISDLALGKALHDRNSIAQFSSDNLDFEGKGTDLAYIIYTSGSTGMPKGAMIRHGGAINHIYAQYDALQLTSNLTFLQSAPASSDISVWQFLAPLLIGGKTIIIDTETVCDPPKLFQTIQQQQITLVELVPQVLKNLLQYLTGLSPQARQLPSLQWMMITGESVSVELVNQWLQLYPNIPVVNAYGPSEASDDITQEIITQSLPANQRSVSIGKPLANLNLYILDRNLQLVPIGVPGEICVSGYGVGLGYWRNEEKTAASFVANPFVGAIRESPLPHSLIYKTGDLGRWLPDGRIEYLGRIDHQVKIRGYRIELGEIETVLSQYPEIKEAVALVVEDDSEDKKLVAYVVPHHNNLVNNRELIPQLRQFLEARLPKQMIPSALMALPSFPLTPSGKIDRRALPAIEATSKEFLPPQTETEKTIAAIWQEVLNQTQISLDDNFFELGGHSLLATQVISRLREQYQQEIPLRSLFEEPTVAQLASYLDSMNALQNLQTIPTETNETNSDLAKGEARCGQLRWRDREEIEL
ncbi:amino acid adenylation domain protein [Stanieria cyanosphaera PCC 7437]|uniref:Amino acid adenylation domain protein n=1 Tax=Stanieria cyanosphaera (strain ATCC 29371 / PCC 7437) TaxID=111780 RepID=K9XUB9_STAC7|nr:non-ribosomal peptide synthetase [Stanieria cyanosphaera]AFZ36195.1 amino acid adenylation domain protein [Stanieria cyanosphaera PCC 7437]